MNTCDSPAKLTTSVPKADTWHVYCIKRHEMTYYKGLDQ